MFEIDSTLQKVLIIHLLICAFSIIINSHLCLIIITNFKSFGTGPSKLLVAFWLVITFDALIYLFLIVKKGEFV